MAERLFGTDGIRGTANQHPMTAHTAADVAMATAAEFFVRNRSAHRAVVIGKDTRISGYMLESAMQAGFLSMGFDVVLTGPLPTPAVASITRSLRAGLGVVISASHNPYADNGIKIFSGDGYKLPDAWERAVEQRIANRDCPGPLCGIRQAYFPSRQAPRRPTCGTRCSQWRGIPCCSASAV